MKIAIDDRIYKSRKALSNLQHTLLTLENLYPELISYELDFKEDLKSLEDFIYYITTFTNRLG